MNVGMATIFQNPGAQQPDHEVYAEELRLAEQAEGLGFDSLWGVEHHFTDYTMCPDVLQFLSYLAGRTRRVQLGSMVVVLPWHDPLRVAEQVAMLDALSGGRAILGIGRGLGRVEFEGFRVPMDESRARFVESAQMILEGLETGVCRSNGTIVRQPAAPIRPRPARTFRGRTYAAAVSPESMRIMAELGIGILIIPQKPWETVIAELAEYRALYREVNGTDPIPTVCAGWVFCDEDEGRAREMAVRWIGGYWDSVVKHYELAGAHFAQTKGYEYYDRMADILRQGGTDPAIEFFLNLQIWGTPKQCLERIRETTARVGAETFVAVFRYAGMPIAEAERNYHLFARAILPELKRDGASRPGPRPAVPAAS